MSKVLQGCELSPLRQLSSWRSRARVLLLGLSAMGVSACSVASEELDPTVDMWVNDAPLSVVIGQLAELSGKSVAITGPIEGQVSGRLSGTLTDTLGSLSEQHGVLFDLQGESLSATSGQALSKVSIVMAGAELDEALKHSVQDELMPGNAIEIQDKLVKLSGHPDFVKRVAKRLTTELAVSRADESIQSPVDEAVVVDAESVTPPVVVAPRVVVEAAPVKSIVIAPTVAAIDDAGAEAMLVDIETEKSPDSDAVTDNESIDWVTDIPGFSTF